MSYDICYDRCFIRSGMGITPMWLVGSNNCTESVYGLDGKWHERRERHWSPLCNLAGVSEAELMKKAQSYVPSHYNQHFKRGGKWVDDAGWIRFVENGIKKAVTIEQIVSHKHNNGIVCEVTVWLYDEAKGYHDKNWYELQTTVHSTEEFDAWLSKAKDRVSHPKEHEDIWFSIRINYDEPIRIAPEPKAMNGKVAAKYKNSYIVKVDIHGISYSKNVMGALIFDSLEAAKKACEGHGIQIQYVDGNAVAGRKEWRWCIRIASGVHQGEYLRQKTASRIKLEYNSKYAKKFPTKAAAEKYIADLKKDYKIAFEAVEGEV